MAEHRELRRVCPYLGLADDRDSSFSYPEAAHVCYAAHRPTPITLEHQSEFCLTQEYPNCPRFVEPSSEDVTAQPSLYPAAEPEIQGPTRFPLWAIVLAGLVGTLVVVAVLFFYRSNVLRPSSVAADASQPTPSLTPSLVPTPSLTPSPDFLEGTPTPAAVVPVATPTPTATPPVGDSVITLSPATSDIGWVSSGEERNHFGDSFLYAGIFDGEVYQSGLLFDLSSIPPGAPIRQASLQLTGLRGDLLGAEGAWTVRLLAPEIHEDWRRHGYQEIFNAPAQQALTPILAIQDLVEGQANTFELSPDQIEILEERIIEDENPEAAFRVEGPLTGLDNVFVWDTGYGPRSEGNRVVLSLRLGPPPATPLARGYVVVTSTPTPENVLTAAAIVAQVTADATRIGTATPLPPNLATATPIPSYLVVVPTATPGNQATARALAVEATARALTTGTPTPVPTEAITATPGRPTPTFVMITATPTAESVFSAATISAAATGRVQSLGSATPVPANWVTPLVVTSTPTPANQATAQYVAALSTAQAFTTGTPTPTPVNMVTATPTPVFVLLDGDLPPLTATPVPAVSSRTMPPELIGKIAFKSDRTGEEMIYVINPDGSGLGLLSDRWPYELARQADVCSVDGRFRVFVKDAIIDTGVEDETTGQNRPIQLRVPALYFYDEFYQVEEQLTYFGVDEGHRPVAYEPAWSPTAEQIAFVSDDSGNDEIWIINSDSSGARQLTHNEWEWDKHPSWSPDGRHIVFWSNRTGNRQIWVMDAEGGNLFSLSRTGFNDWDPVWIKYPDASCQIFRPPDPTALCEDGTYSFAEEVLLACGNHGGVLQWLKLN